MGAFILLSPAEAAAPALRAEFDVFMKEKPHRVRWPLLFVSLQFPNHCRRQNFFRRTGCLIVVGLFCFASGLMFVTCSFTHLHYFITRNKKFELEVSIKANSPVPVLLLLAAGCIVVEFSLEFSNERSSLFGFLLYS